MREHLRARGGAERGAPARARRRSPRASPTRPSPWSTTPSTLWWRATSNRATALLARDAAIDEHYGQIFQGVLDLMAREPAAIYRATRVQSIAKYLERIADHATNIAETVVFLVKGTDIRHLRSRGAGPDQDENG
ncbi:MAG: PhoU domain-containing protein [Minicystis sp.]